MRVLDKVVVLTGAGNGIGRELALELLRRGASVAACDIDAAGLRATGELAAVGTDRFVPLALDLMDRSAVDGLPGAVLDAFGSVDGLINCAGIIQPFSYLADLDGAAIDRVFGINWLGTLHLTRAFLPLLLKRPVAHVVNVASMGGVLPIPGQAVYGASKAAVKLMTEALYAELLQTNVRVTVVLPGAIATNIAGNSGVHLSGSPEEEKRRKQVLTAAPAAKVILDGMEADRFRVLVDKHARIMDTLYRLSPRMATRLIASQLKDLVTR
jgi:NAD(P)-dependent dehydrogenase (short-subunit alcohol dehydrogenase family)